MHVQKKDKSLISKMNIRKAKLDVVSKVQKVVLYDVIQ